MRIKTGTLVAVVENVFFVAALVLFGITDWKLAAGLFLYEISVCLTIIDHVHLGRWKDKEEA